MGKHFEYSGGLENMDNAEKTERPEKTDEKEKESILDKAKNFFGFGERLDSKKDKENTEKSDEKGGGLETDRHQAFVNRLREGVPHGTEAEIAKQYREEHGLDEHGNKIDKSSGKKADTSESDDDSPGADGELDRGMDVSSKDDKDEKEYDMDDR